jgi:predicted RNase H-like HicB family nuclease
MKPKTPPCRPKENRRGVRLPSGGIIQNMIFHVTLEHAEDGWVVAECPALPGCVSQGRDEKEALENIKEAITAWLWAEDQKAVSSLPSPKQPIVVTV